MTSVTLTHAALHFNGTSYRVDHGRELDQLRIDQRLPMPLQLSERAFLIHAHETAVAGAARIAASLRSTMRPPTIPAQEPFRTRPSPRGFPKGSETGMTRNYPRCTNK